MQVMPWQKKMTRFALSAGSIFAASSSNPLVVNGMLMAVGIVPSCTRGSGRESTSR